MRGCSTAPCAWRAWQTKEMASIFGPSHCCTHAGDTVGSVHFFALFDPAAPPDFFQSVAVHSAEVSALAWAPPSAAGRRSCQLVAVGSKSGAVTVLDWQRGNAPVAQLPPPAAGPAAAPVVSLKWVQQGPRLQLVVAQRDGRLAAFTAAASEEGPVALLPAEEFQPAGAAPRPPLAGLEAAVFGQALAVGGREGGIAILDAFSGDGLASLPADKSAGVVMEGAGNHAEACAVHAGRPPG